MATARVIYLDEQSRILSEEHREVAGTSVDDIARAARATLVREGCTVRSASPTGNTSVLVYAYPRGRAPKELGPPPGWVGRKRAPSA